MIEDKDRAAGTGNPGQFGKAHDRVAEMVDHERRHHIVDRPGGEGQGADVCNHAWRAG